MNNAPSPEKIMQFISGGWVSAVLGSAARHGIFAHLEGAGATADDVAKKSAISRRGAQALLDGLTGVGILKLEGGRYKNTPEASAFLLKGKPGYIGAMAEVMMDSVVDWAKLHQSVKNDEPAASAAAQQPDKPFLHEVVTAIATLSIPVAQIAAEKPGLAKKGAISWLDVGG